VFTALRNIGWQVIIR